MKDVSTTDAVRFTEILVPVDGSPPSERATELAIRLAKTFGASITFCHVIHVPFPMHDGGGFAHEQLAKDAVDGGRIVLDAALQRAQQTGIQTKSEMPEGPITDSILAAATAHGADIIVMGTHGRGALGRLLLGSKTADVLARSPIPVLVCPGRNQGAKI